jgi:tetratricopeptide (TPR) repeat protein
MAGLYVNEDISTEVIRQTLREGKSQLIVDAISAPGLTNRNSVILSGLRSVLTVPLKHSNGLILGLLYADNRVKAGAFKRNHQELLRGVAQRLVAELPKVEARIKETPSYSPSTSDLEEVRQKALALAAKGSFTEGLSTVEQWIAGRPESHDLGIAYGVKGRILQQMGQMSPALESVAVAVYILGQRSTTNNEHYALMLNNLAGLHVALDNHHRAHGLLTASASYWARLANSDSRHYPGLTATQYNLGKLHQELGSPKDARLWFEQALASSRKAFGENHPKTAKIQSCLEQD